MLQNKVKYRIFEHFSHKTLLIYFILLYFNAEFTLFYFILKHNLLYFTLFWKFCLLYYFIFFHFSCIMTAFCEPHLFKSIFWGIALVQIYFCGITFIQMDFLGKPTCLNRLFVSRTCSNRLFGNRTCSNGLINQIDFLITVLQLWIVLRDKRLFHIAFQVFLYAVGILLLLINILHDAYIVYMPQECILYHN